MTAPTVRVVARVWTYRDEVAGNMASAEKELSELVDQGYVIVSTSLGSGKAMWTLQSTRSR